MDETASPVDQIEEWRRKASNFSSIDRLGNLIARSLEVLKCMAKPQISVSDLEYALESLDLERNLALKHDKAKDTDVIRSLMYGVIESIGLTAGAVKTMEREQKSEEPPVEDPIAPQMETTEDEEFQAGDDNSEHLRDDFKYSAEPEPSSSMLKTIIKEEDTDQYQDELIPQHTSSFTQCGWNPFAALPHHSLPSTSQLPPFGTLGSGPVSPLGYGMLPDAARWSSMDPSASAAQAFKCTYCGLISASAFEIEQHVRTHTNAPAPYACEECGKTFAKKAWLVNHNKEQHADRSSLVDAAREEQRMLREERAKYACSICGQKFTDRSNHRRHVRRQHGLRCQMCDESFDRLSSLKEHHLADHGVFDL